MFFDVATCCGCLTCGLNCSIGRLVLPRQNATANDPTTVDEGLVILVIAFRVIMKFHTANKYFGVHYLSIAVFWYAIGADIIQDQFVPFKPFTCDYTAVCATSKPSRAFAVRSIGQCSVECRLYRESCVGFNYLAEMNNTCEIFAANPTSFSQTVAGCQYLQVSN